MNEQYMALDVSKEPAYPPAIYLGQGDKSATTLITSIYDNGEPLDLSGNVTVKLIMRSPDDLSYYEVGGTIDGSTATFLIDETYAASVSGTTDTAYVEVNFRNIEIVSTNRFRVVILESAEEGVGPSRAYHNGIFEAIDRANAAAEAAEGVVLQDVPLMSENVRGGAQLGYGLKIDEGKLSLDDELSFIQSSEKGSAGGVAELDSNGLVISSQLPSYVDDVLEYASTSEFPATGESGKIYVALDTNLTYRWTGSAYAEISPSLALGETSSTAYRGDRGAAAYAHAVTNKGSAFSSDLYKITTNSEGHVTAATPATSADIIAFINNQAIAPSSVAATGDVTAVKNGTTYSLGTLGESVSSLLPPHGLIYSLESNNTATTTKTTINTLLGRKFSDYQQLLFVVGTSTSIRGSITISRAIFENSYMTQDGIIINTLHGSSGTSASGYNVSTITFWCISDTSYAVQLSGSATLSSYHIFGLS